LAPEATGCIRVALLSVTLRVPIARRKTAASRFHPGRTVYRLSSSTS